MDTVTEPMISSDSHIVEPPDLWEKWLEPEFRPYAPKLVKDEEGGDAWLYNDGKAVLHVVEKPSIPDGGGVLDHIAFWGTDAQAYVAKLRAREVKYDLRRLPQNGHAAGVWQLFFFDPSGARVEIDFAASETVEGQG